MNKRMNEPDEVSEYISSYLDAIDRGIEVPAAPPLDDTARAELEQLLAMLTAEETRAVEDDIELRPIGESSFAVRQGFARPVPDVVIVGDAVRRARSESGLDASAVAEEMTRRGFTYDGSTIDAIESAATRRMAAREARLLAAVLRRDLHDIEATADPWPAHADLSSLREAGADAMVLGDDAVVRTSSGSYLGLIRCRGRAVDLDSWTYRIAAATLLNGRWSHFPGALLVSEGVPYLALAVDAIDCIPRSHAPTGLSGFSKLARAQPIVDAIDSYDNIYTVSWTDPERLDAERPSSNLGAGGFDERVAEVAEEINEEGGRARQMGKRSGYELASQWFLDFGPQRLHEFLLEIASMTPGAVEERLDEALST